MKPIPKLTLPEPDVQLPDWRPLIVTGEFNALILSDVHVPYHDKDALMCAVNYGKSARAKVVLLNGDVADYYELSKFAKDPRARKWTDEIKMQRHLFAWLRQEFPKARIIYKLGNHDERYEHYMMARCPELLGLDVFEISNVLELKTFGIELVRDKRPIRLGQLNVLHGHEYQFAISNPVNAARGLFLRCKEFALCGHFHQESQHSENTVEGRSVATWSTGCLCDLHPAYRPINNWSHGFALVEVAGNGKFRVQNKVIRNGNIY
jgi:predicted phosphodiesterase